MTAAAPAAERKSSFFLGFLLLPPEKRAALSAVYAYCRLIDDIVDEGQSKEKAREELDFWRSEVGKIYLGTAEHPVARDLIGPVKTYGIPKEELLQMIRGCALDLEETRYETPADLESYTRGVAGSVGIMCARIFGPQHMPKERVDEFAVAFGHAFQLTNIIRDVGADLELGRVYLPDADLRAAGLSTERLRERVHDPAFVKAMEVQYRRAKEHYAKGRALVDRRDRGALAPAEVMAHVYEGLLDDIRAGGFRVLHGKTTLSKPRKLWLAFRGWLYSHGL
ncbi:MAG: presqualene diphosphate synthase HpnD [Elusimicrobiota bacterium]|nr:MAG: presqualene diphosphate synthase HpnD [Elusimicrobiota bacterium]